ncbi:hypothetical protein BDZ89DRAFT_1062871, partial [Hymenopellis radicata]
TLSVGRAFYVASVRSKLKLFCSSPRHGAGSLERRHSIPAHDSWPVHNTSLGRWKYGGPKIAYETVQ